MTSARYTVGIVCSGNTCRSPVTAAWLRQLLSEAVPQRDVSIWTAGLQLGVEIRVHEESLLIAQEMGLSRELLDQLETHKTRSLKDELSRTDLLAWITDPTKINATDDGKPPRADRMKAAASRLGATLLVIPETDAAWVAKQAGAPANEVFQLYRDQGDSLRRWASVIHQFIP